MTAGTETRQFFRITAPISATARTMTAAIMVARQARVGTQDGIGAPGGLGKRADGLEWPEGQKEDDEGVRGRKPGREWTCRLLKF